MYGMKAAKIIQGLFCILLFISSGASAASFRSLPASESLRPSAWGAVHARLHQLAARYPKHTRSEEIGRTHNGRPLYALHLGDNPKNPTILLSAAQHANEAATPQHVLDAVMQILERKNDEPYRSWLAHVNVVVVPMMNPDGSHRFWEQDRGQGRKNGSAFTTAAMFADGGAKALGVDLNRNYPFGWGGSETRFSSLRPQSAFYRGPAPASEPEVRAVMALADRHRFLASISYHSQATRLIVPGPRATEAGVPMAWRLAERMVKAMPHQFGRRKFRPIGGLYPVTGVEKDWLFSRYGTLAYVLELPYRRATSARLRESIQYTRGAWMTLLNRWENGPSLSVHAVTSTGDALNANIQVLSDAHKLKNSKGAVSGWAHFYMPDTGRYMVRVQYGGQVTERDIQVGHGINRIQLTLPVSQDLMAAALSTGTTF